jgi:uncharacterized LabA/DUF88 family protein
VKTYVYVDGFNLYYGCLKDTPYKWLDPIALARIVLPKKAQVVHVRYFTAPVSDRGIRAGSAQRQQSYLRALATLGNLSIHYGSFLSHPQNLPLASPQPGGPKTARVIRTEEKGSDVNIAAFMLLDGFKKLYDQAALVSNDSYLLTPVEIVRNELGKSVIMVAPTSNPGRYLSHDLSRAASMIRKIRPSALRRAQLPAVLTDGKGTIRKPSQW